MAVDAARGSSLTPAADFVASLFPNLEASSPPAFRFIDLFAGIGGIRMGLERAGGHCVYTVEIDRFAVQTYSANFGRTDPEGRRLPEDARDIHDVSVADLPPYDVLAGGFPCQSFSLAGVSKKLSLGRAHGFDDKKTGNLFFEIARLIDEALAPPKILFLENVKHLRHHDGGRTFQIIWNTLKDRGYNVSAKVVDARYWVPQHRERTYIIGLHRDTFREQHFEFPEPPNGPRPVLGDILKPSVEDRYTLTENLWVYLQAYAEKHRAAGNGFGFGLVDAGSVARTLSARYHKDGSEILVRQARNRPRRLTPRECARLMGFPDTFRIPVSDTQAYRQFGNSVVVPVIEALARALVEQTEGTIAAGGRTGGGRHRRR